jgi:putative peptidoglycan lipid II flippase
VRAGYLEVNRALMQSLAKFALTGVLLAAALWLTAKFAAAHLSGVSAFRDEIVLLILVVVGTVIYAGSILLLFGPRWLRSLVR